MTGRERIEKTLEGRKIDRIPWTTIADEKSREGMPREYSECDYISFYRKIGCDILAFGKYAMPNEFQPRDPFYYKWEHAQVSYEKDGATVLERRLGGNVLTSAWREGHPVKYPVETQQDAKALLEIWKAANVLEEADFKASCVAADEYIGEDGVFALTLLPSPVQMLIENECGPENFYYLLQDEPALMDELMDAMFEKRKKEYEIAARLAPFRWIIPVENTSTTLISPKIYRKYTMPHMAEFARVMHENGKKAIVHMCGLVKGLLREIRETGIDGIHALTEPPIGDCTFCEALDALGEQTILVGTLQPAVFQSPFAKREDIFRCVKVTLTKRIVESNFILCPCIDGLPTPLWKLQAVRDAVELYGQK